MKNENKVKKKPKLDTLRKQVEKHKKSEAKHKEKEKLIKASSEQWRTIFDAITEAVCLLDIEGKIIRCNKAMSELLNKPFNEIVGRTYWDLVYGTSKPSEDYPIVRMKKTLKRETLMLPLNNRWVEITVDPIFNASGVLSGIVHIITDITESKKAEEALRDSEERFRNLMEYIPESIQGYTLDGTVFYWNKASEKVYGYTAKEVIGKNLGDMIIPSNLKPLFNECLEIAKRVKQSGEFMPSGELMLLHKEGHPVPVYSIHTAVYIDGKEPLLFCIDVDLSEHKKAEEKLKNSEKELKERVRELEEFYNMAVGRELRMIELKKEIERLNEELEKYKKQ